MKKIPRASHASCKKTLNNSSSSATRKKKPLWHRAVDRLPRRTPRLVCIMIPDASSHKFFNFPWVVAKTQFPLALSFPSGPTPHFRLVTPLHWIIHVFPSQAHTGFVRLGRERVDDPSFVPPFICKSLSVSGLLGCHTNS